MKQELKEIILYLIFSSINLIIAYSITAALGISNTIVIHLLAYTLPNITPELIIWFILILFEMCIYAKGQEKKAGA